MDKLYGIKLLSLYKQHYRDSYKEAMSFQYSSWGYYDGFDIFSPNVHKKRLSKKITALPISDMWFGMEDLKKKNNGKTACQTIGIFRNSANDPCAERFWKENEDYPFFAIGFLQLAASGIAGEKLGMKNIRAIQDRIDSMVFPDFAGEDAGSRCLAYYTLDNSDLVVLFHSNSMTSLQRRISKIENFSETSYMHTILGTSEKYLQACHDSILSQWGKGINCHLDDPVYHLTMRLVTRSPIENQKRLRWLLERHLEKWPLKGYEHAEISDCFGHESISLYIKKTDVQSLLSLLLPNGIATHQNSLYNLGLYNFQTSFALSSTVLSSTEPLKISDEDLEAVGIREKNWCNDTMEVYRRYLERICLPEIYDESMITYLNAIIQSLNTLAQYENFRISRNIFYLLYPAFRMFTECFTETMEAGLNKPEEYNNIAKHLKENIDLFLEAANSIIYHTIHTDQIFLMLPGYSGTSYAIPVKLQLMYLGFLKKVGFVLNDRDASDMDSKRLSFCFFIAPLNEAPPLAEKIAFKGNRNNALVRITVSQRSLSFPRALLIILAHECAHYIGQKIRIRHIRATKLYNTLAYLMADMLFAEIISSEPEENTTAHEVWRLFSESYRHYVAEAFYVYLSKHIRNLKERKNTQKEKSELFYASNLEPALNEACVAMIGGIDTPETLLPEDLEEKIRMNIISDKDSLESNVRRLDEYMESIGKARQRILAGGYVNKSIKEIIHLYKELFSDLTTGMVLGSSVEDMKEAMLVSEGMKMSSRTMRSSVILREELIEVLLSTNKENLSEYPAAVQPESADEIYKNLIDHKTLRQDLHFYGRECKKRIIQRLEKNDEIKENVTQIRGLYSCFKDDKADRMTLYQTIGDFVIRYSREIEAIYEA